MKEIEQNRRAIEHPRNDKERNFQDNAKELEGDKKIGERLSIREMIQNATSRKTPRNMKEIKKTGERLSIREMIQNATSRKTPRNMKEIEQNRRAIEHPRNDKERNFQDNAKELEGDRKTGERLSIREMIKNATSRITPRNLKEIKKNRKAIEHPRNDTERNFQENAKERWRPCVEANTVYCIDHNSSSPSQLSFYTCHCLPQFQGTRHTPHLGSLRG